MSYVSNKHDLGIVRTDSSKVGLILANDAKGSPLYFEDQDEYLAEQRWTGVPGYDNLPPEKELALRQDDWRSGFGQYINDAEDTKRYHSSIGMDLRHKGMAIAGPKPATVTRPGLAAPVMVDGELDVWTSSSVLTNWTFSAGGGSGVLSREATTVKSGTYSAKVTGTTDAVATISQDVDTWTNTWQSQIVEVSGWCWCNRASEARIQIYDGQATTSSRQHPGDSIWRYIKIRRTLDAAASVLTVILECGANAGATNFYWDKISIKVFKSENTKIFKEFNSKLYMGSGILLSKLDADGAGFTTVATFTNEITDLETFVDGKLYIALGTGEHSRVATACTDVDNHVHITTGDADKFPTLNFNLTIDNEVVLVTAISGDSLSITRAQESTTAAAHAVDAEIYVGNKYYSMNAAETTAITTDYHGTADRFQVLAATMWKSVLPNRVWSATDMTNPAAASTNWTATTVDSSSYDILELLSDGSSLYIKKEDRTFYLTSAGAVAVLIEETRHLAGETSGRCGIVWQGKAYIGCGAQSLVEYDGGTITWRSPAKYCTNLSEFIGNVFAVAGDEEYLFAITDNSTKVEVLAGRSETISGSTDWVWHPITEITLDSCYTAIVSSVYQKRLWISSSLDSDSLYYIPLPTGYGNVASDTNRSFNAGGYFITPFLHGNFKGDDKAFIKITLNMSGTSSTVYYTVEYQLYGSSNWTEINSSAKFKTSPATSGFLPVDDVSGVNPVKNMIRFKITAVVPSPYTSTPVLLGYDVRAILYPTRRSIIHAVVRCADDIVDKQGIKLDASAATIKATLDEAVAATWPVTIYDPEGTTKTVRFLSSKPFSRLARDEKSRNVERQYYLSMQCVDLS